MHFHGVRIFLVFLEAKLRKSLSTSSGSSSSEDSFVSKNSFTSFDILDFADRFRRRPLRVFAQSGSESSSLFVSSSSLLAVSLLLTSGFRFLPRIGGRAGARTVYLRSSSSSESSLSSKKSFRFCVDFVDRAERRRGGGLYSNLVLVFLRTEVLYLDELYVIDIRKLRKLFSRK